MAGAGRAASPRRVAYRHDWGQPLDVSARDGSGVLVTLSSGSPRRLAGYHGSVARRRSPARLVIALSVAAVLAVFLLYTSIAGGGTPTVAPSELGSRTDVVSLGGIAVGPVSGDAHAGGPALPAARPRLGGERPRRRRGLPRLRAGPVQARPGARRGGAAPGGGTFVATPGTMITKCPSKYAPKKSQTSAS